MGAFGAQKMPDIAGCAVRVEPERRGEFGGGNQPIGGYIGETMSGTEGDRGAFVRPRGERRQVDQSKGQTDRYPQDQQQRRLRELHDFKTSRL